MLLGTKEKFVFVIRVILEFPNNVSLMFETFLQLFPKRCPVVQIFYDSVCDILMKLLERFMKPQAAERSVDLILGLLIAKMLSFTYLIRKMSL